jgi:parallel beta-helix repeat protein
MKFRSILRLVGLLVLVGFLWAGTAEVSLIGASPLPRISLQEAIDRGFVRIELECEDGGSYFGDSGTLIVTGTADQEYIVVARAGDIILLPPCSCYDMITITDDLRFIIRPGEQKMIYGVGGAMQSEIHCPQITYLEFREWILAYGQPVEGKVSFKDPDGDIVQAEFAVVEAEDFEPFSFDPKVEGQTEGEFTFSLSTTVVQDVTLELTLIDREGNRSDPWRFSFSAREADIVVPRDYGTIQEAIDAAEEGAVIYIRSGTYRENIEIKDKSLTLQGTGRGRTHIKAAEEKRTVVWIYADYEQRVVRIEGLSVSEARGYSDSDCYAHGIAVGGTVRAEIVDSAVFENKCDGVIAWTWPADPELPAWGVVVTNSNIYKNGGAGIYGDESALKVVKSTISENSDGGIVLGGEAMATIFNSNISANEDVGIVLSGSAQAVITDSTFSGNGAGIWLGVSARAEITGSIISGNDEYGIWLEDSARAEISDNIIKDHSRCGIYSESSGEVRGEGNNFFGNGAALCGNLPGTLRIPLVEATEEEIVYPDERYSSLQEAVDALLPGGKMVLRAGEHEIESGVVIDKELRLEPARRAEVTLRTRGGEAPVLSLVGGARLELADLEITGGYGFFLGADAQAKIISSSISGNKFGIVLWGLAQAEIIHSTISKSKNFGIQLWGTTQVTITDSSFSKNRGEWWSAGIRLGGTAQATITDSSFSENTKGISLTDNAQATITDSTFFKNGSGIELVRSAQATIASSIFSKNSRGISLKSWSEDSWVEGLAQATITDSSFSENGNGISLTDNAQATISGSTFSKNGNGVWLGGEREVCCWRKIPSTAQATITNSKFTENKEAGIHLKKSTQVEVSDSGFSKNGSGIVLSGSAQAVITNATIHENEWSGLFLDDGWPGAEIRDSTISKNGGPGIHPSQGWVHVIESIISENESYGIDTGGHATVIVSNSEISKNNRSGIRGSFDTWVAIEGSVISGNNESGIIVYNYSTEVSQSTISENGGDGIKIVACTPSTTSYSDIEGNKIINNRGYGVFLDADASYSPCHVKGKANTFYGNRKGAVYPSDLQFLMTSEGGSYP